MQNSLFTKNIVLLYSIIVLTSCSHIETKQDNQLSEYKNAVTRINKAALNEQLPMTLFVYAHNAVQDIQACLDSICAQDHTNYRIIIVNDGSRDGTLEKLNEYVSIRGIADRIKIISHRRPQGELFALYTTLNALNDNEIVVLINAHDKLVNQWVLSHINNEYALNDTWLTFGSSTCQPHGCNIGLRNPPIPDSIVQNKEYRKTISFSPLRTFYAWLFKLINKNDLLNPQTGKFYEHAAECHIFWPMMEMADSHIKAFTEVTYVINCNDQVAKLKQDYYVRKACNSQMGKILPLYSPVVRPT